MDGYSVHVGFEHKATARVDARQTSADILSRFDGPVCINDSLTPSLDSTARKKTLDVVSDFGFSGAVVVKCVDAIDAYEISQR